ncbi:MAG: hypothetical protein OXU94_11035 [Gammaproteobacteria bacterium]|nr:hypothetical protein [Gammaproteobacteria bacterium]
MNNLQPASRYLIAMGAAVSSLLLLLQVAFPFPLATLSAAEMASRAAELQRYYIFDTAYTLAWLVAWAGIAAIIGAKSGWLTVTATTLTFIGMLLGLVKNEWTNALAHHAAQVDIAPWWFVFKAVGRMSFICVVTGMVLASVALYDRHILRKIAGVLGVTLVFVAALGLYMPALFVLVLLWGLLWTLCVTALLFLWAKDPQKVQ